MNFCAIGTGSITVSMLQEFARCEDFNCIAIYSRNEATGRAMAGMRRWI